jgi:hypothetical protein
MGDRTERGRTVADADRDATRRAVCPRFTLYTEFGNYSLIGHVKQEDQKTGDQIWRPVRTNWKNHRDDKTRSPVDHQSDPPRMDSCYEENLADYERKDTIRALIGSFSRWRNLCREL